MVQGSDSRENQNKQLAFITNRDKINSIGNLIKAHARSHSRTHPPARTHTHARAREKETDIKNQG